MFSLPKQPLSPKTEKHAHAFAFSTFPNKDPITPKVLAEGVLGAWGKGGGTLLQKGSFFLPPVPIMFFYALAAAQISRAFSAAEEASGV